MGSNNGLKGVIVLLLSSTLISSTFCSAPPCDPSACQLPDCRCSEFGTPGDFTRAETPQVKKREMSSTFQNLNKICVIKSLIILLVRFPEF